MGRKSVVVCRLAAAGCAVIAASQAPVARAALRPETVFLPYANMGGGQTELTASPELKAGFNGGTPITFTMDSGSTGIVVSPDNFTPPQGAVPIGSGTISYTSSGRVMSGEYYMTEVQIGTGTATATAKVPVLQVTDETCLSGFRRCVPEKPPTGVAMMGVGFGGTHDTPPNGTPDKNPFLHIVAINGKHATPEAGYVLTALGATLGITAATARHFHEVPLSWNTAYKDWNRPPASVTANGWTGAGAVLIDTGVANMYLVPPQGDTVPTIPDDEAQGNCIDFGPCAAKGVSVNVKIGMASAQYTFRVGADGIPNGKQKAAPAWVTVEAPTSTTVFVNTSYHFLNRFDYLYDYTLGVVGFRSAPKSQDAARP